MGLKSCLSVAVLAAALGSCVAAASGEVDRLQQFHDLAARRMTAVQQPDPEPAAQLTSELYALLDDEVLDSLASGSVFGSLAFLQERLDGFAETWGGASLKLTAVGPLIVGAFHVGDGSPGMVRVYATGRSGPGARLLDIERDGRPTVHVLPSPPRGPARFLLAWDGAPTGRGTRALRLDLVREQAGDVRVVWSTAELFAEGLLARTLRVRGSEVRIRYELRYQGWQPGCARQTEHEDVYRIASTAATVVRVSRQVHDGWHQALHRAVAALVSAVTARDAAALGRLVPDPGLRRRLPAGLEADTACDAPEPAGAATPATVSVAATEEHGRPWALVWRHTAGQWRLSGAMPVLQ